MHWCQPSFHHSPFVWRTAATSAAVAPQPSLPEVPASATSAASTSTTATPAPYAAGPSSAQTTSRPTWRRHTSTRTLFYRLFKPGVEVSSKSRAPNPPHSPFALDAQTTDQSFFSVSTILHTVIYEKSYADPVTLFGVIASTTWKIVWISLPHCFQNMVEGKFQCPSCGAAFSQKGNCRRHIQRVHLKNRWYSCPYCQKSFSRLDHMKYHVISHTKSSFS
jgi:uncharacterized Zn-finger protein